MESKKKQEINALRIRGKGEGGTKQGKGRAGRVKRGRREGGNWLGRGNRG